MSLRISKFPNILESSPSTQGNPGDHPSSESVSFNQFEKSFKQSFGSRGQKNKDKKIEVPQVERWTPLPELVKEIQGLEGKNSLI